MDRPDPQWPQLLLELVAALERLEAARKEVAVAEQDVRAIRRTASRMLNEHKPKAT